MKSVGAGADDNMTDEAWNIPVASGTGKGTKEGGTEGKGEDESDWKGRKLILLVNYMTIHLEN